MHPFACVPPAVFRWRFVPHDVWVMHSRKAYANCDFSAGSATRKTGISFTGNYKYKVPKLVAPWLPPRPLLPLLPPLPLPLPLLPPNPPPHFALF
ncbi:unnamed protein product [Closterium sp. NIES-53]